MHHLIGIAFSHFVEKARWALDRYDVEYRESRYLPMFHMAHAAWASRGRGRGDRVSSRFSTPILITDDGTRICDSSQIVRYASDRWGDGELYESEEAGELEQHFHDRLAPDTRMIGYWFSLGDPVAMGMLFSNVGRIQRGLGKLTAPLAERVMRKTLNLSAERTERAIDRTRAELDTVSQRLADGRRYLTGDRFTAADLAFSCAIAPILLIQPDEGYSVAFPTPDQLPQHVQALREELRATPAAQFALRCFREERARG